MEITIEWFFKIPGLFITVGVLLVIVAIIIFIVGNSKAKKEMKNGVNSTANVQNTNVNPTPSVNQTTPTVTPEVNSMVNNSLNNDMNNGINNGNPGIINPNSDNIINNSENGQILGTLGGAVVRNTNTIIEKKPEEVQVAPTIPQPEFSLNESIMPNVESGATVITPVDVTGDNSINQTVAPIPVETANAGNVINNEVQNMSNQVNNLTDNVQQVGLSNPNPTVMPAIDVNSMSQPIMQNNEVVNQPLPADNMVNQYAEVGTNNMAYQAPNPNVNVQPAVNNAMSYVDNNVGVNMSNVNPNNISQPMNNVPNINGNGINQTTANDVEEII